MFKLFHFRFAGSSYILASTFLVRLSFGMMLSTFPVYLLSGTGTHIEEFGFISTFSPLFEFLTVIFFGVYIDMYGKKRSLLMGLFLASIAMAGIAISHDPYVLIPFVSLNGVAAGIVLSSSLSMITEITMPENRGYFTGIFDSMNILGWAFGYLVGFLYLSFSIAIGFLYIIAAISCLLGFGAIYIYKYSESRSLSNMPHMSVIIKNVFTNVDILYTIIPWFIVYIFIGSFLTYLPVGVTGLKIPYWEIAIGMGIGAVIIIKIQTFFGKMSDKMGRLKIMFIGGAGFAGLIFTFIYMKIYGTSIVDAALIGIFGFFALAFAPSSLASLGDIAPSNMKGTTMALYSFVISGGMVVGIPATSYIYTVYGIDGLLTFFSFASAIMIFLLILRWIKDKKAKIIGAKLK